MMRILLVRPGSGIQAFLLPNLALGYLASALRGRAHHVRYLDCFKERVSAAAWKDIIREGYDVIGIQMFTVAYDSVRNMCRAIKKLAPHTVTVVGGPHANALPEQILRDNPEIDYVICGESEKALPDLVDMIEQKDLSSMGSIANLAWRDYDRIKVNKRALLEDLDDIAMPAWDLMDPRTYSVRSHSMLVRAKNVAPIFATRGCPYRCAFCTTPIDMGSRIRRRTPSKVVDEIEMLVKEYDVREIHFEDANFTFYKDFTAEVCQAILDRKIKISWSCPSGVRLDCLDADLLRLMERSGCYAFALGIESGSDRMLKLMKKSATIDMYMRQIRLVAKTTKICMMGFFMYAFPGETMDDWKKTEDMILNMPFRIAYIGPFHPFPGSPIYKDLLKEKKIPENPDWSSFSDYSGMTFSNGYPVKDEKWSRAVRATYFKFYLKPRIILGMLSEIRSIGRFFISGTRWLFIWLGITGTKGNQDAGGDTRYV